MSRAQVKEWPFINGAIYFEAGRKQISIECANGVVSNGMIMADTMVCQSKQELKETQGQFLPHGGHCSLKEFKILRGMKFCSLE